MIVAPTFNANNLFSQISSIINIIQSHWVIIFIWATIFSILMLILLSKWLYESVSEPV